MSGKPKAANRSGVWKAVLIAEIVVCYMAVLAVISYARGPGQYRVLEGAPILTAADFTAFDGKTADGGSLAIENTQPGQAAGWQAEIDLTALEGLQVCFQANCPRAGGTLIVDLYNGAAGYDSPEQEAALSLPSGSSQAQCSLAPGKDKPDTALLRLFTLDSAGWTVEGLSVRREEALPKVPGGLWAGAGVCFLLLAGTAALWRMRSGRRNRRMEGDSV